MRGGRRGRRRWQGYGREYVQRAERRPVQLRPDDGQPGELSNCGGTISLRKCLQCGIELRWQIERCCVMTKMDNLSPHKLRCQKLHPLQRLGLFRQCNEPAECVTLPVVSAC